MEDNYRSAVTGQYVSKKFAEEHPKQTVREKRAGGEKLPPNDEPIPWEEDEG